MSVHFELEPLGGGVWASIARPDRGAVGNAAIVDLGGEALVVDTHFAPAAARDLRVAAERLVGPVRTIVNTHWHGDHVNGNASMPAEASILATPRTRELIVSAGADRLATLKASLDDQRTRVDALRAAGDDEGAATLAEFVAEAPGLEHRLPDTVFAAEASVGRARALTSGGGHTESDAVVHVAEAGVLVCGDLLFVGIQPWVGHGDPRSWLTCLDRIAELDAAQLVPGHGPVSGPESLAPLRDYLGALVDALDSETAGEAPARFAEWVGAEMWARNLDALRERGPSAF